MADNEQKMAEKEAKLAAKAALKEKKDRIKQNKPKKNADAPNIFVRILNAIKKFFKDFRGTAKKIVWPDRQTVLKSSAVVLAVVLVATSAVFVLDWVFSNSITLLTDAVGELNDGTTEAGAETTEKATEAEAATSATTDGETNADGETEGTTAGDE